MRLKENGGLLFKNRNNANQVERTKIKNIVNSMKEQKYGLRI